MRKSVSVGLGLIAGFLCVVSFLPIIDTYTWWVRMLDFPRLQLALALVVLATAMVVWLGVRSKRAVALLALVGAALLYHLSALFPYAPTGSDFPASKCPQEDRLSILVANVQLGNEQTQPLIEMVRREKPDLLLAMETNEYWDAALAVLDDSMPHTVQHIDDSHFGIHLFSRLPLVSPAIRFFADQNTPQIVTGVTLRSGETIDFLGIHPRPPHPWQSALGRDAVLQKAAFLVRDTQRAAVLAGDFNATPWESATALMQRVGRLLDPREGYGYVSTYNAESWWMSWPLDHVFYQRGFAALRLERLGPFGSDHYPYLTRLCRIAPKRGEKPPEATAEDLDKARGVIELATPPRARSPG